MDDSIKVDEIKVRKTTAQQKLNNFLRSKEATKYHLSSAHRIVLHALASYFYYSDECNPSYSSLSHYTQLKERYLVDIIQELEEIALIKVERKIGVRNRYFWHIPHIQDEEIYRRKSVHNLRKK